ncbi:MAG: trimeric intracellular cation channel family protein [Chitinophagaceae bacterium]|nr:MAG: trimeric intracellular cation channel family protein [Chitinophagaceae bacterium]
MINLHSLYTFIDLAGTFAFAISGAVAARDKGLDVFGVLVVSFTVACGGGIIRDVCIGAIPPAGLSDWRYLLVSVIAAIIAMGLSPLMKLLDRPVILFDALGLSLFAVSGAEKALSFGHNNEVAILLGMITAVGGGVIRDIFLNRIPVIFEKEIYASAALLGAVVVVAGHSWGIPNGWVSPAGFIICLVIRLLALKYHWKLPSFSERKK